MNWTSSSSWERLAWLLLSLLAVSALASCSLVLDFDQCAEASDCSATGQCVAGLCQEPERVEVTNHIVEPTTWTSDKVYVLANLIMVVNPGVLTIEPGTTILGRRNTGLVSLAGARIEAEGTREDPIIFTSDKPRGQRLAGDWAGVGLVGEARVNRDPFNLRIQTDKYDTVIGGTDDTWDCGTLKYVRIEFGGSEVDGEKALDGLTLAGCGNQTEVEYVQTHMSDDDGVGVFGGTVDLRHVVSTRAQDDAFDLDTAWRGTAQFIAAQQDSNGTEAIEVENLAEEPEKSPLTDARIYNFTLLGAERQGDRQIGLYTKLGGKGHFSHGLVMGQKSAGLFVEGPVSGQHARDDKINVEHTLFYDIGESGTTYFGMTDKETGGFTNYDKFKDPAHNNLFGADPGIERPYDLGNPSWVPAPTNTTGTEIEAPPSGFDTTAVYRGAFAPGQIPWTEGWTDYPKN